MSISGPVLRGETDPAATRTPAIDVIGHRLPPLPTLPPSWSQPRLRALVNGTVVEKAVSAEVERSGTYQASRYHLTAGLSLDSFQSALWWDQQKASGTLTVEIQAGYLPAGSSDGQAPWQQLIIGDADRLEIDYIDGMVRIDGRDFAARLIDTQLDPGTYQNQTSSEIISALAAKHGITPQVTGTNTTIGRYFEIDTTVTSFFTDARARTEWDLAVLLAELEGFDLYLDGGKLVFAPQMSPDEPFQVIWQPAQAASGGQQTAGGSCNVSGFRTWQNMNLLKHVTVQVVSFSPKTGEVIRAQATGGATRGGQKSYSFTRPGMTQSQAQNFANQRLKQILHHFAGVDVEAPAVFTMGPQTGMQLSGTGTAADQVYYINTMRFSISVEHGASMHLSCNNQPASLVGNLGSSIAGEAAGNQPDDAASSPGATPGAASPTAISGDGSGGRFNVPPGGWINSPKAAPYLDLINANAATAGLTPAQFANQLGIESGYNPNINGPVLPSGEQAQGIAQILPSTAARPGYGMQPLPPGGAYDPQQAIPWAAQYMGKRGAAGYSGGGYTKADLGSN